MTRPELNTIHLDGGLDDVEMLVTVEETFGVKIEGVEAERLYTIGQLYDLVCSKLSFDPRAPCLSARAFRRLRDAAFAAPRPVRPSTSIEALRWEFSAPDWCRTMSKRTSLDFDILEGESGTDWLLLCIAVFLPPVFVAYCWSEMGAWALVWLAMWVLLPPFRGAATRVPPDIRTAGDLVRRSMGRNYTRLIREGEAGTRADVWLAVCGIARDVSGYEGPINRDTTFFAKYAK